MLLIRSSGGNDFMPSKPSSDFCDFTGLCYSYHSSWLRLFLALSILCCQTITSKAHFMACSKRADNLVCPRTSLAVIFLSLNDACQPVPQEVIYNVELELINGKVALPSRVAELNETMLEQAFSLLRSRNRTVMLVLFYADWCPFSKTLRPSFDMLSYLFPSIYHVAVDGPSLRPSVLSKYGVHSFPLLFLHDKASREKYRGSRKLEDLIMFLKNRTGLKPLAQKYHAAHKVGSLPELVTASGGSRELCPFSRGLSFEKWLQNDTYLTLATWFLILRLLLPILPWASSKLKRFWNGFHAYLSAKLRFFTLLKEKPGQRTFGVELPELESKHFTRRWSNPLFS